MNKKKWIIIGSLLLTLVAALVFAIPAVAAAASPTTTPAQITPANKPGALIRLLLVQDQTKAFAYIAQAEADGKITADQSVKIQDFWTAHHKQFAWNFALRRLLSAQNESNVKTYLDKAVVNGKITVDQENKVLAIWEILHIPAPATTTNSTTAPAALPTAP
jgi:flagellar basal body-associated protein FliL